MISSPSTGALNRQTAIDLAAAALACDALRLRSLAQDLLRTHPKLETVARPDTHDAQILGTSAALVELLSLRTGQTAPAWTRSIGAVPVPTFLVAAASRMPRLRALCEAESPEPLRKRGLYAPPDFLSFA